MVMESANEREHFDVAVLGGGLAGLAAATTAARAGARTVLVEPRPLGGRARAVTVDPGVVFNGGPRALYLGGPAQRVLGELGIDPAGGRPPLQPAGGVADGKVEIFPTGPLGLARTHLLGRAVGGGVAARARVAALLAGIQRIDLVELRGLSVDDWIEQRRLPAPAAALIRAVVRLATYVDSPAELAADAAVGQLQLALGPGVRYLDGGWQQLVDRLASVAERAGVVQLRGTASSVDQPSHDGGGPLWRAQVGEAEVDAGSVVIAAGAPAAASALTSFDLGLSGIGEPATAACLELAVQQPPRFQLLLGIDQPLYLARHAPPAELSRVAGVDVVHVARYGATSAGSDREQLWAHAASAGVRRADVVADRFLARMTVTGGVPLASAGGLPGRPPVEVSGAVGLFIAGDWVGDEGMLADAALASGAAAGRRSASVAAPSVGSAQG